MPKTPSEVAQLEDITKVIEDLPDEKDGIDLRTYKRHAIQTAGQLRTQLFAVLKLAS